MEKDNKWPQPKKMKTPDGTIVHHWDGKLHNWDGPALIPQGVRSPTENIIFMVYATY